jgi:signal transduction histidine kinase
VRFLVIDDNRADRELVKRRLRREFPDSEFVEISKPSDLDAAMADGGFDIVLTDYQLNWSDGLQIFNSIKVRYPDIPVVMVTGTGSEEIAVEGLRAGLSNYILKKHLDRLPLAVHEVLERTRLQRQYNESQRLLKESEENYRELFEQGLTGVFVGSADGTLSTCNAAFAHMFGFDSMHAALQTNFANYYPEQSAYKALLNTLQREKRIEYQDVVMRGLHKNPVYIVGNIVGVFDDDGALKAFRGYFFDNTEHRNLVDQLQQSQKLESIGLLVSGIAHDFNNMLGGILGYASRGLAKAPQNHPLHDILLRIHDSATRAAKMTQQLLAFSRRQVLEPIDVNLNTVIENLLSFIGKILADHIDIEFLPDLNLKTTHVDYTQVEQVIINLCINARDAMPDGGRLTIETRNFVSNSVFQRNHPDMHAEEYVLLCVSDTGTGMSEETMAKIFEPFFTTKELGKGTGLGLSMVHGIVGQHNGVIDVESVVDKGTTFKIYFPAASTIPARQMHKEPRSEPEPISNGHQAVQDKQHTILVVEDDPDLRYLMVEVLEDYGYKVMSASDGFEGLEVFEAQRSAISLIVSDLMTPKMKGKELYDRVHTLNDKTKFLFVSGYQANQISQNFVLDKSFEFLPKPFDLDELASKVEKILA